MKEIAFQQSKENFLLLIAISIPLGLAFAFSIYHLFMALYLGANTNQIIKYLLTSACTLPLFIICVVGIYFYSTDSWQPLLKIDGTGISFRKDTQYFASWNEIRAAEIAHGNLYIYLKSKSGNEIPQTIIFKYSEISNLDSALKWIMHGINSSKESSNNSFQG